jgi:hypothetical protein
MDGGGWLAMYAMDGYEMKVSLVIVSWELKKGGM